MADVELLRGKMDANGADGLVEYLQTTIWVDEASHVSRSDAQALVDALALHALYGSHNVPRPTHA